MEDKMFTKEQVFVREAAGEMDIGGWIVPSINAPIILLDDIREYMLESDPPFAVLYWDEPEGRKFIMFSKEGDSRVDLNELVKSYRGSGSSDLAAFRAPPQKDMAGEFIPLALEFPPDDIDLVVLWMTPEGDSYVRDNHHVRDGEFEFEDDCMSVNDTIVAWSYMPELPDSINGVH